MVSRISSRETSQMYRKAIRNKLLYHATRLRQVLEAVLLRPEIRRKIPCPIWMRLLYPKTIACSESSNIKAKVGPVCPKTLTKGQQPLAKIPTNQQMAGTMPSPPRPRQNQVSTTPPTFSKRRKSLLK